LTQKEFFEGLKNYLKHQGHTMTRDNSNELFRFFDEVNGAWGHAHWYASAFSIEAKGARSALK
jgi:hypothetical protein